MKNAIISLMLFCFFSSVFAGELRSIWKKAKENAEKELKKAKQKPLSSFIKCNEKFEPTLDEYQKAIETYKTLTIKNVLYDSKWKKPFHEYCKKTFNDENWDFYFLKEDGIKSDNENVRANTLRKYYKDFIKASGTRQLNLNGSLSTRWEDMNKKRFYVSVNQAQSLMKDTKDYAVNNLMDPLDRFKNLESDALYAKLKIMYLDCEKQIKEKLNDAKMAPAKKILLDAIEEIKKRLEGDRK